jgi:hypothetical protein
MFKFYLDNTPVYPANAENFRLSFLADPIDPNTALSETFIQFFKTNEENVGFDLIENYQLQKRYLEALEVRIESAEGLILWEGFAELSNIENTFTCDFISLKLIEISSNIRDRINDMGLLLMEKKGFFLDSDYVPVKIARENIPNGEAALFTSFALFQTLREVYDITAKITNPVTAVNGVVYAVAVTPLIVNLINDLRDQIIPDARYYRGVKFITIFENCCNYLNLTFESSIFEDEQEANRVWLPSKDFEPVGNISNAEDRGIPDITFGQFVDFCEKYYNARIKISNGVMKFERWDYYTQQDSGVVLPDLLPEQSGYRTNLNELSQTYIIDIARDETDLTTINNIGGYLLQSYVDIPTSNTQNLSLKGANMVSIEHSRGHIFLNPSTFEIQFTDIYNAIATALNTIGSLIGNIINIEPLPYRVGALTLSDFRFNNDKIIVIDGSDEGNLSLDNDTLTSAAYLYDNFHSINNIINNQWLIYDSLTIPVCDINEVTALRDNNYVTDTDGNIAQVEENTRDQNGQHTIKYRVKKDYLNSSLVDDVEVL